jgi:sec-independent protein translocase protein TatA
MVPVPVPVPLFPGVPGGPELLIILLVIVILGIPLSAVILVALGVTRLRSGDDDREERIAELEREVERLREDRDSPGGGDGEGSGTRSGSATGGESRDDRPGADRARDESRDVR